MVTQAIFQVPPLSKRTRIPIPTIRALANHILTQFNPEKIILFGSHAYGNPSAWSDVDFLVVMDTPNGELETAIEISNSFPELSFSVDIIVRSQRIIEKRKNLATGFSLI